MAEITSIEELIELKEAQELFEKSIDGKVSVTDLGRLLKSMGNF